MISDKFGRKFSKLRVSLTNQCNFSCTYCVLDSKPNINETGSLLNVYQAKTLSTDEYLNAIQSIHDLSPLSSVRLTGGEPLLYKSLGTLIKGIKQIGIKEVTITTNGYYLESKALELKEAGIDSINVSLDALDEETFRIMAKRSNLKRVLDGIDAALQLNIKLKINTVVMLNMNHLQIIPILDYCLEKKIIVRYLELMSMGHLYHNNNQHFFSQNQMLELIEKKYQIKLIDRTNSSTANYWQINEGEGRFGIIANETNPFCHDCNRLRLDSKGKIYGCISSSNGLDISAAKDKASMINLLKTALGQKQELKFSGSPIMMRDLGG